MSHKLNPILLQGMLWKTLCLVIFSIIYYQGNHCFQQEEVNYEMKIITESCQDQK